jgi:hypothetical protein
VSELELLVEDRLLTLLGKRPRCGGAHHPAADDDRVDASHGQVGERCAGTVETLDDSSEIDRDDRLIDDSRVEYPCRDGLLRA